jgi:hypothetical protein
VTIKFTTVGLNAKEGKCLTVGPATSLPAAPATVAGRTLESVGCVSLLAVLFVLCTALLTVTYSSFAVALA